MYNFNVDKSIKGTGTNIRERICKIFALTGLESVHTSTVNRLRFMIL